ncbi:hypothetical protein FZEAL_4426 [Fusarium zealandicum]|uniref:Uncharacterized protein n=1 Tax=Fusarium zealandicum TaxID=1053134 RepID=A0A8H4UMI4_9HYPO|nr:hypothetical protein FZEAL_4426 [Fusarium zealandicum]
MYTHVSPSSSPPHIRIAPLWQLRQPQRGWCSALYDSTQRNPPKTRQNPLAQELYGHYIFACGEFSDFTRKLAWYREQLHTFAGEGSTVPPATPPFLTLLRYALLSSALQEKKQILHDQASWIQPLVIVKFDRVYEFQRPASSRMTCK